ncbi:ankyrin repeat domain-containing protein 17-like protein [Leptotrombidium deliense]|uniref:Ankyrin repeat domain-containing protein 17-like protein n=1 Tax=Leptotrombidium deliense TaxID=299467 RepID=A0A443SKV6_9ACAR|nr:ankyrin repeat domain-containing protein 17-like protein [Leptotrombidium deliense]
MSTWKQPLKTGDCVNFQMQSSTVPSSDLSASATSLAQQPTTEQISEVSSASATPVSADVTVSTVASQTILSNISPNTASGSGNRTRSKQTTKVKNTTVKQQTQLQPSSSQSIADNVEKMNLRNVMNNEQQQASLQSSTDLNQTIQSQQQYILSELAQSFSNLRQAKPEAFFQQSASHVKFDTPLPFLLPPLFELNSFSQSVGLQPQHQQTQSTQTLISSLPDVFDVKKPIGLQSQVTQQLSPQHQQTQSTQTSDIQNLENYSTSSNKQLAAKSSKSVKIGTKGNQNQTSIASNQQQNSPITSAALVPSLTSQQLQLNSSTGLVIAGATTANTAYGTLVPTSGVFALGAPAFPVTLSLSPTPSAASVTTSNNGAIYQQPLSLETTEVNASFLLKSHQRSLPDGAVSDFALGTSASHTVADNCFDGINYSNSSALFTNTVTSVPVGIESISFPQIPVSSATNNQTKMMTSNNLGTSSCSTNVGGSISTSVEQAIQNSLKIPQTSTVSVATVSTTVPAKPSSVPSPPPWYPPIDLDSQTDSNHDTALTLACAGGHEELVQLLLNRGANMEHRDKKGFTPLMLAATAGHANVCEILLSNNSDIEAQSERTKDTALSLACSSGRYEVVELLLSRGANKEHRNVSDYTPLSLAASGGYVNIIKLLLSHGAEINSRTGSKLGISPLMLAAMNGHAATVKLLLDMGSDINAQIETNRNTALTLACFQGRCEVVSLLLDRKANVEHRAKTGLTPLMEAASGGYVEVGRILLDKGADVNAPPVPSSRDTALTIAADKGHYRFVELLLQRGAQVDVKNKKGSSPLWLACNGGHLDVVQLLVNSGADIDSQDNRKVSCLMASFRKGHVKVVKWMVKHVTQFPSDQEMTRYLALISDKELMKKCNQCVDIIRQAKEKQAAEANKNATILLEEIDMERSREESRKLAAARRRERKRQKKKEKQEQLKAAKIAQESKEKKGKNNESKQTQLASKCERKEDESDFETDDDVDDSNDEEELISSIRQSPEKEQKRCESNKIQQTAKKKEVEKNRKNQQPTHLIDSIQQSQLPSSNTGKKREEKQKSPSSSKSTSKMDVEITTFNPSEDEVSSKLTDGLLPSTTHFIDLSVDVSKEIDKPLIHLKSPNTIIVKNSATVCNSGNASVSGGASKKVQKREEGWKEVVRRSKKVSVPANAISRVIGRAGCNINTVREISGAHIEVEKQKMQGDRQIIIKGSADATRHAQQLINGLVNEPEKELSQIIQQLGLNRPSSCNGEESFQRGGPLKSSSSTVISNSVNRVLNPVTSGVVKSASVTSVLSSSGYVSCSVTTTSSTRTTAAIPVRPTVSPANVAPPFANNNPVVNHAWGSSKTTLPPRLLASANSQSSHLCTSPKMEIQSSNAKTLVYNDSTNTAVTSSKAKTTSKSSQSNAVPKVKLMTNSDSKPNSLPFPGTVRPQSQPFSSSSRVSNVANKVQHQTKPFGNSCVHSNVGGSTATTVTTTTTSANTPPEYSPFNNLFSKVAQQSVWGQTKESHKPNFASVAASGISSVAASQQVTSITSSLTIPLPTTSEPEVTVDASKAPGYRGNLHVSPSNASLSSTPSSSTGSNFGPIGSGPRSAPCTPPLLAMSSHNTNRQSTPPSSNIASTPPPVNRTAVQEGYQQELNNSQNVSYSAHSVVSSTFQQSSSTNFASCISSQQMKSNAFNLAPGATVARTFTNTTYSQHAPVSSVGQIHPPLNGNECLNVNSMQPNAMNITGMSGSVQSSLNPNAPDFSSRSSTSFSNSQSTQQSNGSTIRGSQHHSQPRSMAFQDVIPNPQLQMQMRAAILAAGASLQMQTLQAQAAQAQAIQNRFQFGQSNFTPAAHHHQQAAAAAAAAASLGTPDFTPPSAETLRLLHTAISAFPAANAALHASTPQNMQQFGLMQTAINLRQQQTQARIPSGASINVQPQMAKECEASSTENHEERKLPRPIGTERAQKKNPGYATSNNQFGSTSVDVMQSGIWPFSEVNVEGGDWLQTPIPAESMTNVLPNSFHARNYRSIDDQQTDSAVEHPFLTNNATSAYANVSATPVVNGLPPQMVAQPNILYHNTNVAPSVANPNSTLQEAADYWTGKMPNVPGLGNGVSTQNTDHKLRVSSRVGKHGINIKRDSVYQQSQRI